MPAPRKQSPNSPETDRQHSPETDRQHSPETDRQPGRAITRAEALRWWRAGYQAGHQAAEHEQQATARWDQLVASYRTQHAADQQVKINALLLELIDVLARLLGSHDNGET